MWKDALWCYLGSFPDKVLRNIMHETLRDCDGPDLCRLYKRLIPAALDDPTTDWQLQKDIVSELCSSCPYPHALPHHSALPTPRTKKSSGDSNNFYYASPRGNLWFTSRSDLWCVVKSAGPAVEAHFAAYQLHLRVLLSFETYREQYLL